MKPHLPPLLPSVIESILGVISVVSGLLALAMATSYLLVWLDGRRLPTPEEQADFRSATRAATVCISSAILLKILLSTHP